MRNTNIGEPDPRGSTTKWLDSDWINVTAGAFHSFLGFALIYLIRGHNVHDKNKSVLAGIPIFLQMTLPFEHLLRTLLSLRKWHFSDIDYISNRPHSPKELRTNSNQRMAFFQIMLAVAALQENIILTKMLSAIS